MALYRCPKCGEIVRKDAKNCATCGLWFDLEHEPWLDDGSGRPEHVRKKDQRIRTIVIVALAVSLALVVAVSVWGARTTHEYVKRLEREGRVGAVTQSGG